MEKKKSFFTRKLQNAVLSQNKLKEKFFTDLNDSKKKFKLRQSALGGLFIFLRKYNQ